MSQNKYFGESGIDQGSGIPNSTVQLINSIQPAGWAYLANMNQYVSSGSTPNFAGLGLQYGTAPSPSLFFTANPTTGVYHGGNLNELGIATNGVSRMLITDTDTNVYGNFICPRVATNTNHNCLFGDNTGKALGGGTLNTAIGESALQTNIVGVSNTAVGSSALNLATSGENTGVGQSSLVNVSTGGGNSALGSNAGKTITTGITNTILGIAADVALSSDSNAIAIGYKAVAKNNEISIGNSSNTKATFNNTGYTTFQSGVVCGRLQSQPNSNCFIGDGSGSLIVGGSGNTVVGDTSFITNVAGTSNVCVGFHNQTLSTGKYNTSVGSVSQYNVSTGESNTTLGYNTGNLLTTGGNNTIIGATSNTVATGTTNAIAIGYGVQTDTNQIVIGNSTNTTLTLQNTGLNTITGAVSVLDTTESASTITGSIITSGGVGIAKAVRIGSSTDSTTTATGALICSGGLGLAKKATIGGAVSITDATDSTTVTTGALICSGGLGLAKKATIGGVVSITDTTDSTTTSTGCCILSGGLGVAKNINCATVSAYTDASNYLSITPSNTSALVGNSNSRPGAGAIWLNYMNSAMTTNNDYVMMLFGQSAATRRSVMISYNYATTANQSWLGMGLYGQGNILKVYGDGRGVTAPTGFMSCSYTASSVPQGSSIDTSPGDMDGATSEGVYIMTSRVAGGFSYYIFAIVACSSNNTVANLVSLGNDSLVLTKVANKCHIVNNTGGSRDIIVNFMRVGS